MNSHDLPCFSELYPKNGQSLGLSCLLGKLFSHFIFKETFGRSLCSKLTINWKQNSWIQRCLFWRFVHHWKTKWVSLNIPNDKKLATFQLYFSYQFETWYNAGHSASKTERIKNWVYREFYVTTKMLSNRVTRQTSISTSSNHVTETRYFASM